MKTTLTDASTSSHAVAQDEVEEQHEEQDEEHEDELEDEHVDPKAISE